MSTGN